MFMKMIHTYFRRITLFTVMVLLCLAVLFIAAISQQPFEVKSLLLYRLFAATIVFLVIDIFLKQICQLKSGWLWAIQGFPFIAGCLYLDHQ